MSLHLPDNVTVTSSHGELVISPLLGVVLSRKRYNEQDPESEFIDNIVLFDMDEWRKWWGYDIYNRTDKGHEVNHIDILDLGCFFRGGGHEPPTYEWRLECAMNNWPTTDRPSEWCIRCHEKIRKPGKYFCPGCEHCSTLNEREELIELEEIFS